MNSEEREQQLLKGLAEDVKSLYLKSLEEWKQKFPSLPVPFLTTTYRSIEEQNKLYAQGRTTAGKIVTNAKGGQSNHNTFPSPAFDICFRNKDGSLNWDDKLFVAFAAIAVPNGLAWGGNWHSIKDKPHFERKGLS